MFLNVVLGLVVCSVEFLDFRSCRTFLRARVRLTSRGQRPDYGIDSEMLEGGVKGGRTPG